MMAVDTSALMAIVLDDLDADACVAAIASETHVLISAGTLAEALIVAARRNVGGQMSELVGEGGLVIVPVTGLSARRAAAAYKRWGKGLHPAGLNFGDCFAYALAEEHGCPLLFVGEDFSRTDIESVLRV